MCPKIDAQKKKQKKLGQERRYYALVVCVWFCSFLPFTFFFFGIFVDKEKFFFCRSFLSKENVVVFSPPFFFLFGFPLEAYFSSCNPFSVFSFFFVCVFFPPSYGNSVQGIV